MTRKGVLLAVVALCAALGSSAAAAPESAPSTTSSSPLKRYQARLEAEATRILSPEVQGAMKDALGRRGTDLWACTSIASWQQIVTKDAAPLSRACQVLVRRSEVIWTEERLADAYASPIVQMASVHALQRGLGAVLSQLGVKLAPPAPSFKSFTTPTSPAAGTAGNPVAPRAPVVAMATTVPPATHRAPTPAPARPAAPVLSPAELAVYTAALENETYRILTHEVEGSVLDGVLGKRTALRTATTVSAWKSALADAHPALVKAAAVLERRTEVLRGEQRVLDAYDSVATQRAAVRGLQQGLERILRQFGK